MRYCEASFDEVTVAPLIEGCEELEENESRDCFEMVLSNILVKILSILEKP